MKEMKKYQFKTNINCSGCVEKVTPFLHGQEITGWTVNTADPRKILTVETSLLTEKKIIELVSTAGFKIEILG